MKTKFGLAVGLNIAVACLVMQGCKAPRVTDNKYGNDVKTVEGVTTTPTATDDIKVANTPAVPDTTPVVVDTAPAVAPTPSAKPKATPAPAAEPEYTLYKVKAGDMLSKISKRYNVRQKAILDLNPGLSPNKLYAGKTIKLPGKVDAAADSAAAAPAAVPVSTAPATASAASVKAPNAAKAAKYTGATKTYVVKSGDSLSKIASENGTNVRTLKELNGLKNDRVFVGKKLKVPAEKAADTAKKPEAKKAEAKKAEVKKAEPAKKDAAKPAAAKKAEATPAPSSAEKPAEPVADTAAPAKPAPEAAPTASSQTAAPAADASAQQPQQPVALDTHTVKDGEDVVSIAISYGVSPSALMDANDLKSSEVKPGDVLKIPAKSAQ